MLEIRLRLEKDAVSALCRKCGKIYGPSFYAYRAENNGTVLAAGLFEVKSDRVQIIYYESGDAEAGDAFIFDGILRAGLNYAGEQGIETGCIPEDFRYEHRGLFAKLNYPASPDFNIVGFFSKYKNCNIR